MAMSVVNIIECIDVIFNSQIPMIGKHKPVPKTTYQYPKDQEILDEVKEENRKVSQVWRNILVTSLSCLSVWQKTSWTKTKRRGYHEKWWFCHLSLLLQYICVKFAVKLWFCLSESVQVDSEAQHACHDGWQVAKDASTYGANCGSRKRQTLLWRLC